MIKIFKRATELKRVNSKKRSAQNLKVFCVVISAVAFCSLGFNSALASDITVQKVIDLTNADRTEKGLSILKENDKLKKAAENKADDMVLNDYFSHNSPEGLTPWHWMEQEKYDYNYAGENLAMDFTTAEKMNEAWLASPTHRANILNEKYKNIGIAVKEGMINGHSTIDVVQMFGSGDRNKNERLQDEKSSVQKSDQKEAYYPSLPLEKKNQPRAAGLASAEPMITSPQQNELVSQESLEVVGRSTPKDKVAIWDDSQKIGQIISDEDGWFHLKLATLTEGEHSLKAQSEIRSDRRKITENPLNEVSIFIDRSKPQVKYRFYADEDSPNGYLLEAFSDKPNCVFKIGGEAISAGEGKTALFSVVGENLSTVLKVEDQAGNKTAEQIVLANYYQGNGQSNIIDEMAQMIIPEKVFADDSGRGALKKNLGLAIADLNH
ncbi:CAP domain-containing protein [bacterium]|nr:MAG: CAP domain-containing protein [bacterium]